MRDAIRSRTIKFLGVQVLIFLGLMTVFLLLAAMFFVRNASGWHARNMENDLRLFVAQAVRSGEVPKRGDLGNYSFFIVDLQGRYILPRLPRSDESERSWQESEAKILYEMQKRRDAWSYYPEVSRWDWKSGQYALRYMPVDSLGWIVAVEGYLPGKLDLLREVFTPELLIGMILILVAAVIFMQINASWHFHRVTRAILRSQENNFIDGDNVVIPSKKTVTRGDLYPSGNALASEGVIGGALRQSSRRSAYAAPVKTEADPALDEPAVVQGQRSPAAHRQDPVLAAPPAASSSQPRRGNDLGAVTIDTSELRSSVLRKAIEELRESRR